MSQPAAPKETQNPAASRILVVDDEQHMCDVCTRTLQRAGYTVVATVDSDEAIHALRTGGFDLLLTDIKMPTISGFDLANIARERDPAIAIIIMTGFASVEHLHQSVQRGVADFLSKPFELDHLRLAVDQALHKRSLLQDNVRLKALTQLQANSEQLGATLDVGQLTSIVLRVMLDQSGCAAGFLLLSEGQHVAPEDALLTDAGRALADATIASLQPRSANGVAYATLHGQPLSAAFAVPLRTQGVTPGVLLLCDQHELKPAAQESVLLLTNHAASALRNAYLYSELDVAFQRLQELDRLKSEFIAIASHELRTPLSIVLGYGMMIHDQSSGDQREYMQRVMESAQRIKEVVDDMVSLRHLETGELRLELESITAQELIAQVVGSIQALAAGNQLEVLLNQPDAPLVFESDREKVLLILNHLLSNAVKFTPHGGRITVSTSLQRRAAVASMSGLQVGDGADGPDSWVVFSFQDTGIGIPEREQRRIFDRFYQVADSLRRDRGGIGLGLALVRELVMALNGVVWVQSREGEGSMFAVALPYHHRQPA
jgi:signal transduction histidine kinase